VRLISRHGAMSMGQLMIAMGVGRTAAYWRLQRCEEAGLVDRLRLSRTAPPVPHTTRDGKILVRDPGLSRTRPES
jgi:hypothetical protein